MMDIINEAPVRAKVDLAADRSLNLEMNIQKKIS